MTIATLQTIPSTPGQAAWQRFARHRLAVAGAAIIDIMNRFAPPLTGAHVLGTDELGRDVLARLMMGGRVSLSIGVVAMVIAMAVGILVGAFAGFYGGVIGAALMRFVDAVLCFPAIFLLLALA